MTSTAALRADLDRDRGPVAGDQAAADIDQGRHRQVAGLVAREQGAQGRALVEAGQPRAAVARGRRPSSTATAARPVRRLARGGADGSDGEVASNIRVVELVGAAGEHHLARGP